MLKALVLCELYNLSDEQFEYRVRDRLSFMRFLGLGLEDPVPDATTVWRYREQLVQAGVVDELFGAFDGYLEAQGWLAMGGQMIDASIVRVPKQRNGRDENAAIKAGETPEGWDESRRRSARRNRRALDQEARQVALRLKNHVNVDRRHKLIRRYKVTDAATHDSQVIDDVLDDDNTASDVWADSAYRSAEIEEKLEDRGLKSRIHRKGHRNRPLSKRETGQQDPLEGPRPGRARVRRADQRHGWRAGAQHRHRPRQGAHRPEEPCLQHAPRGPPERPRRRPRADVSGVATAEVRLERS